LDQGFEGIWTKPSREFGPSFQGDLDQVCKVIPNKLFMGC
jgi:hypothetical protein